jgi:hypothetical protein
MTMKVLTSRAYLRRFFGIGSKTAISAIAEAALFAAVRDGRLGVDMGALGSLLFAASCLNVTLGDARGDSGGDDGGDDKGEEEGERSKPANSGLLLVRCDLVGV